MTRKKQGAPQRLNSQAGKNPAAQPSDLAPIVDSPATDGTDPRMPSNLPSSPPSSLSANATEEKRTNNQSDRAQLSPATSGGVASSCQKLLNFTQNFSFSNQHPGMPTSGKVDVARIQTSMSTSRQETNTESGSTAQPTSINSDDRKNSSPARDQPSSSSSDVRPRQAPDSGVPVKSSGSSHNHDGQPVLSVTSVASIRDEQLDASKFAPQLAADPMKGLDIASLTAAHRLLMDAMQKQLNEQYSSSWTSVQRNDNNCLSKSKAERYRWCVQGGDGQPKVSRSNPASQSHVTNLKKSVNMAGMGVTPVQDKLYSTVFSGASKFCCRDCGNSFNTLVDLTVHMNKTGHFRDTNSATGRSEKAKDASTSSNQSKVKKKRMTTEDESQSEKVLTCMGCGHLFDSLQDLSVHMIKTKHYENVPSLRMWSQKQAADSANHARKRSHPTASAPSYNKKHEATGFPAGLDPQAFLRPPVGLSPFLPRFNNPLAAAFASLYSFPWLAPVPPSMLAPLGANLKYPFTNASSMFPPGAFPPSLAPSLADDQDLQLPCGKCSESFGSFHKLAEHMQATAHFPDLDSNLFTGFPFGSTSPSDSPDAKEKLSSSPKSTASSDNPSSSTSGAASKSSARNRDYVHQQTGERVEKEATSSLDFIRSLESTINSAISKVESPHDDRSSSPRRPSTANGFSPFSSTATDLSSADSQRIVDSRHTQSRVASLGKSREKENARDSKCNNAAVPPVKMEKEDDRSREGFSSTHEPGEGECARNQLVKCESPLDLTLKRELTPSPECKRTRPGKQAASPPNLQAKSSREKSPTIGVQPSQFKSPLQSLHDNMQAFFSLMKPNTDGEVKNDNARSSTHLQKPVDSSRSRSSAESYKPLMPEPFTSTGVASNPLQEILKIVNSADLAKPRTSPLENRRHRGESGLKRPSEMNSPIDGKKSKLSLLLHDLVMPKDDAPITAVNPLQKIQDLVDNKLTRPKRPSNQEADFLSKSLSPALNSSYFESLLSADFKSTSSSAKSTSPPISNSLCTASSAAAALLSLKFSSPEHKLPPRVNGFHRNSAEKDSSATESGKNAEADPMNSSDSSLASSTLDPCGDTSLEELQLEAAFASFMSSGGSIEWHDNISKSVDLNSEKVSEWFARVSRQLESHGQLPFLRYYDDGAGTKRAELLCRRCGDVFASADSFSAHVLDHIDIKEHREKLTGVDGQRTEDANGAVGRMCKIQGSVCIGPFKSFEHVIGSPDNGMRRKGAGSEEEGCKGGGGSCDDVVSLKQPLSTRTRCSDKTSSSTDDCITAAS